MLTIKVVYREPTLSDITIFNNIVNISYYETAYTSLWGTNKEGKDYEVRLFNHALKSMFIYQDD